MEDKMKKKIFGMMILALLVLSFGFLSCKQEVSNDTNGTNGGGNSNPFIGTWICSSEGVTIEITENEYFVTEQGGDYGDEGSGEYVYNGNSATLFSDGESMGTATVNGNTMTVYFGDTPLEFTKQ